MSTFKEFKAVQSAHQEAFYQSGTILEVNVTQEQIWEVYLSGFPEGERQYHDCNCCRHFLRDAGNHVKLVKKEGKLVRETLWDFQPTEGYEQSVVNLKSLVMAAPIKGVFYTELLNVGSGLTFSEKHEKNFEHFFCRLPSRVKGNPSKSSETQGRIQVLTRMLNEWKADTLLFAIQLIEDRVIPNSEAQKQPLKTLADTLNLYNPFLGSIEEFAYFSFEALGGLASFRNTAMGTFIVDLTEAGDNEELIQKAIRAYGQKVDGANYKVPQGFITPANLKKLNEAFEASGYKESLNRWMATFAEIPMNALLYTQPVNFTPYRDVFAELEGTLSIDVRKYEINTPSMAVKEFLDLSPNNIEMLVTSNHTENFVSLLNGSGPVMFKYPSTFSWAYSGNLASSSLKERAMKAGGKQSVFNVRLGWNNTDDLDVHLDTPNGKCYYGQKSHAGFRLDVDANYSSTRRDPVENIFSDKLVDGKYRILVDQYNQRESKDSGYTLELEYKGEMWSWSAEKNPTKNQPFTVDFTVKDGKIQLANKTSKLGKGIEKWGVTTNRWFPVNRMLFSPNWWEGQTGNKHLLFLNQDFRNDEQPRGFFNEQLKDELVQHHKHALQALGDKCKVEYQDNQASGLGFAYGSNQELIVRFTTEGKSMVRKLIF